MLGEKIMEYQTNQAINVKQELFLKYFVKVNDRIPDCRHRQARAIQSFRDNIQGRGWRGRRLIPTAGAWDSASCDFLNLPYDSNFAQI